MIRFKLGLVLVLVSVGLLGGTHTDFIFADASIKAFAQDVATPPNYAITCVPQGVAENADGLDEMAQLRCLVSNVFNRKFSVIDIGANGTTALQPPVDAMGERSPLSLNAGPLGAIPPHLRTTCVRWRAFEGGAGIEVAEFRCLNLNTDSGQFTLMNLTLENGEITALEDVGQGFLEIPATFAGAENLQIDCGVVTEDFVSTNDPARMRCMLLHSETGEFVLLEIQDTRVEERSNLSFFGLTLLTNLESNLRLSCSSEPVSFDQRGEIVQSPIVLCAVIDTNLGLVQLFNLAEFTSIVLGSDQELNLTQIEATPDNIMFSCAAHRTRSGALGGGFMQLLMRCLVGNASTGQFFQVDVSEEAATPVGEVQTFNLTAIEGEGLPDADGDGVPDEDDLCPNFPGRPIANGC